MNDVLGYKKFCSACKGSMEENGELVCRDKNGRFYGLPVKQVLMASCMNPKSTDATERTENVNRNRTL